MTGLGLHLGLYLVTDSGLAERAGHTLPDLVAAAVAGGVTTVQVREKERPAGDFLRTVMEVGEVVPEGVTLLVNDRVDVYLAAREQGAPVAGVHVGQEDLPAVLVRQLIGPQAVLGLSAAHPEQLAAAAASPARVDYVGIGVLRATDTKPDAPAPLGIEGMRERAARSALPAVAIGGIKVQDAAALAGSALSGVAVVSGICAAADPRAAAAAYAEVWK
ncbi:thiamine-phosphate synthase [Kineosporia sp. NBRC 101677]|uniref:thiamine phosphate synthase n=1 Tax=Kineosporia sp. NBRC 101677 TaxID=3032197 RepID=UPI0024A20F1E|nr:thiamine phosphate synthase [Kineosporia sp. NBRC 101677]GLY19500.1 thiamine-phosphate synthase [Kineosporia sp. NBRC 101677]